MRERDLAKKFIRLAVPAALILDSANGEREGRFNAEQAIWGPRRKIQEARNRAYDKALAEIDASCEIVHMDRNAMIVFVKSCR